MPDDNQNQMQDAQEFKHSNPWIAVFGLSDAEIVAVINLIGQVIWGDITLQEYAKLVDSAILKDAATKKQIEIAAAQNRLMAFKEDIGGVEEYIRSLGGTVMEIKKPEEVERPASRTIPAPTASTAAAPMAFSMADEKEIQNIVVPDGGARIDWVQQAQMVIANFGFRSDDEILNKRLENIVVARLKDVRDELETLDALTRGKKVGGMEFAAAEANRLLDLIKGKVSKVPAKEMAAEKPVVVNTPKIEMENGLPVVRLPDDLMVAPEMMDEEELEEEWLEQKLKERLASVKMRQEVPVEKVEAPMIRSVPAAAVDGIIPATHQEDVSEVTENKLPPPSPAPFFSTKTIPEAPILKNPTKPTLDGIRFSKQLAGPVDELAEMTLIEFRRLSSEAEAATQKIKDKIDVLSKEGFDRRHEGIAAWHQSEVSRFYRLLGQTAMSEGKGVEAIISERLMAGKPTLSLKEFEAVMELNRSLRF